MGAPQMAGTVRVTGERRCCSSASPMVAERLAIPLLLGPPLLHLSAQGGQLCLRKGARVGEEVGDGLATERVDHSVDHRSHRLSVCPTLFKPVVDFLLALLPYRDEVLVHEAVQGRRHARVSDVPSLPDLVEN